MVDLSPFKEVSVVVSFCTIRLCSIKEGCWKGGKWYIYHTVVNSELNDEMRNWKFCNVHGIYLNKCCPWISAAPPAFIWGIPYNQEKHYKTILKQHWQFIFLKGDVLCFKMIVFLCSGGKLSFQNSSYAKLWFPGCELCQHNRPKF